MQDVTAITKYGTNSFTKARHKKPRAYRRKSMGYVAFTIGPHNIVRIALEGRRVLAECVVKATGEPCLGLKYHGHCYHLSRAMILIGK